MYSTVPKPFKRSLHCGHIGKPGLNLRLVLSSEDHIRHCQFRIGVPVFLLLYAFYGRLKVALIAGIDQSLLGIRIQQEVDEHLGNPGAPSSGHTMVMGSPLFTIS